MEVFKQFTISVGIWFWSYYNIAYTLKSSPVSNLIIAIEKNPWNDKRSNILQGYIFMKISYSNQQMQNHYSIQRNLIIYSDQIDKIYWILKYENPHMSWISYVNTSVRFDIKLSFPDELLNKLGKVSLRTNFIGIFS